MFSGETKRQRRIDLSGRREEDRRGLVESTRNARRGREMERKREKAVVVLQRWFRRQMQRRRAVMMQRKEFDQILQEATRTQSAAIIHMLQLLDHVFEPNRDRTRVFVCVKLLLASVQSQEDNILQQHTSEALALLPRCIEMLTYYLIETKGSSKLNVSLTSLLMLLTQTQWASIAKQHISPEQHRMLLCMVVRRSSLLFHRLSLALVHFIRHGGKLEVTVVLKVIALFWESTDGDKGIQRKSTTALITELVPIPLLVPRMQRWNLSFPAVLASHRFLADIAHGPTLIGGESDWVLDKSIGSPFLSLPASVPSALWVAGNLAQLAPVAASTESLLWSLGMLVESIPASALGTATVQDDDDADEDMDTQPLPPELIDQLRHAFQSSVLDRVCDHLSKNADDLVEVYHVTRFYEQMVLKWESKRLELLAHLAFSSSLVQTLWSSLTTSGALDLLIEDADNLCAVPYTLLMYCYEHQLAVMDDDEFFSWTLFSRSQVQSMISFLNQLLYRCLWQRDDHPSAMLDVSIQVYRKLNDRHARHPFTSEESWAFKGATTGALHKQANLDRILASISFVLPFSDRVRLLNEKVRESRENYYTQLGLHPLYGTTVRIRRNFVLEDGFEHLAALDSRMKGVVKVEFIDEHGLPEAGVDGGGLFKEFVTTLTTKSFGPEYGLFKETEDNRVYPNPNSAVFDRHLAYFQFLGMVLGKALFDNVLIEPQFAHFFLQKLLGRYNHIDDLSTLDPELFRNLMYLKKYPNMEDLSLTFTTSVDKYGASEIVELVPNGSLIDVTNENRIKYIHLVANFKLNTQIQAQSKAFLTGLRSIIDMDWLQMFSAPELQILISGTPSIDTEDWKKHTVYSSGYDAQHPCIRWFWDVVDAMSEEHKSHLLLFCTSCSRAPLLGFKVLNPAFAIQQTPAAADSLPTSSTCANLLKLPRYTSKEQLQEKLMYAIASHTGFGLT